MPSHAFILQACQHILCAVYQRGSGTTGEHWISVFNRLGTYSPFSMINAVLNSLHMLCTLILSHAFMMAMSSSKHATAYCVQLPNSAQASLVISRRLSCIVCGNCDDAHTPCLLCEKFSLETMSNIMMHPLISPEISNAETREWIKWIMNCCLVYIHHAHSICVKFMQ